MGDERGMDGEDESEKYVDMRAPWFLIHAWMVAVVCAPSFWSRRARGARSFRIGFFGVLLHASRTYRFQYPRYKDSGRTGRCARCKDSGLSGSTPTCQCSIMLAFRLHRCIRGKRVDH